MRTPQVAANEIAMIKVVAPNMCLRVVDRAIQVLREAITRKNLLQFRILPKGGGVMSETKLFEELLCLDIFQEELWDAALADILKISGEGSGGGSFVTIISWIVEIKLSGSSERRACVLYEARRS